MPASFVFDLEDTAPSTVKQDVFKLLETALQPSGLVPVAKAVADLKTLYAKHWGLPSSSSSSLPSTLPKKEFFVPFHTIGWQIRHDDPAQDKIIEILIQFRNTFLEEILHGEEVVMMWDDLPAFEEAFAGAYDRVIYTTVPGIPPNDERIRKLNFNSYAARLLGNNLLLNDKFCIFALADALEGQYGTNDDLEPIIIDDPAMIPELTYHVAVVSEWIKHAGTEICFRGPSVWAEIHGPLVTWEENGISGLRWDLWKSRLAEVEACENATEETRILAGNTMRRMQDIEINPPNHRIAF